MGDCPTLVLAQVNMKKQQLLQLRFKPVHGKYKGAYYL